MSIIIKWLLLNFHVHFDQIDVNFYLQTLKTKYDINMIEIECVGVIDFFK